MSVKVGGYLDFFGDGDGAKCISDAVVGATDTRAPASDETGSRYALTANRLAVRTVPTVTKYRKSGMTSDSRCTRPSVIPYANTTRLSCIKEGRATNC